MDRKSFRASLRLKKRTLFSLGIEPAFGKPAIAFFTLKKILPEADYYFGFEVQGFGR